MDFPDVPDEVLTRVLAIGRTLPETEPAQSPVGHELRIRRRIYAYVFSVRGDADDRVSTMLVVRADPDERMVLLAAGHPYFAPRTGRDRVGIVLDDSTDWEEMAELVTESYRLNAPKKLAALLDDAPG